MDRQEFLDSRSELYLDSVAAMRRGEIPPSLSSTRAGMPGVWNKHMLCWDDVITVICFLVGNRKDAKRANCYHTPAKCNYKQWCARRNWYNDNIKDLEI